MLLKVLGISGSPREAATAALVRAALLGADEVEGVQTGYISLSGKNIQPCNGCEPCLDSGACVLEDDMTSIYPELLEADAILIGSPVYFGTVSGLCKAFLERVEGFGIIEKKLRLKVGGALATGGSRNGGQEMALATLNLWFHINDMIPIGMASPVTQWGVTGHAAHGDHDIDGDVVPLKMSGGEMGSLEMAWLYGRKIATVARIVNAGLRTTGLDLPDRLPYGFENTVFPASLYRQLRGLAPE